MGAPHKDRGPFLLLVCVVFAYVLARAILVPITNDECTSFLAFAQPGTFLPFASMWDANNHYLSTALGALGYRVLGFSWLALRWASVVAFMAYAWGAWRMGRWIGHRAVRWSLWCALLLCPMLLDFFALYRGYGIAMAGTLLAVEATLRYTTTGGSPALRMALFGLLIAGLAMIALVPLWGLLLLVLLFAAGKHGQALNTNARWKIAFWWGLFGAAPFAGMFALALIQHRLGLLYYGSTAAFIPVTLGSLNYAVLGADNSFVRLFVLVLFSGSVVIAVRRLLGSGPGSPIVVIAFVLGADVVMRVTAAHLIGLNYPEDRAALHLLLLFILFVALAADAVAAHEPDEPGKGHRRWLFLVVPLWYLPFRTLATADLEHTALWPEQSIPERFVRRARAVEDELGRPAVVGTYRLAGHPWSLQARHCDLESDASAIGFPHGAHDLRVADIRFLMEARVGYAVIDSSPANGLYLLQRKTPLVTAPVTDTSFSFDGGSRELIEAGTMDARALRTSEGFIDARGLLSGPAPLAEVRVAVVVTDGSGAVLHNDLVFLGTRRERWTGEEWHILRPLPVLPSAHRLHLYFWDPLIRPCAMRDGHLSLSRVLNGSITTP